MYVYIHIYMYTYIYIYMATNDGSLYVRNLCRSAPRPFLVPAPCDRTRHRYFPSCLSSFLLFLSSLSLHVRRRDAFSRYGELTEARVVMERDDPSRSRGFGNHILAAASSPRRHGHSTSCVRNDDPQPPAAITMVVRAVPRVCGLCQPRRREAGV